MDIAWYIPLLIFFARLCDVPIGTVRMLFTINGAKSLAAGLGFFEVIIWALAVGGVITYLTQPIALIAYGAGFSCGTLIGMRIEEKIAVGWRMIRVINPDTEVHLAETLRSRGIRATSVDGHGQRGPVEIVFIALKRKNVPQMLEAVQEIASGSFVTVERAERASAVVGAAVNGGVRRSLGRRLNVVRK